MIPLDQLMKLMRETPLDKVEEWLKGLIKEHETADNVVAVTMRCFYRCLGNMYLDLQPKINCKCTIIKTDLCDIPPGTVGTILKEMNGGYAVDVTAQFKSPHALRSDPVEQTRTFFFRYDEVEILHEPEPVCPTAS